MGVYEGGTDLSLSLDPGGHATTQVVVAGARKGPDLFLVLSAYDPVVWNFHGFPTDRLRGVLVYGYYHQAVAHLSNQVPVVFATRPAPQSACGRSTYAYKGGAELDRFVRTVEAATGRPVDAFQGGYSPDALHVDGGAVQGSTVQPEPAALRSSGDVTVDAVAPGDGGIRQLLREGYLRPATPADVADWNAAATRASRSGHLAPVQSDYLRVEDSLVVLRRTRLPKGMYGAHARAFIVPHKALLPDDSGSHNSFYFLDDGSCTGAGSGC